MRNKILNEKEEKVKSFNTNQNEWKCLEEKTLRSYSELSFENI